jgi:hypothetical protein
MRNLIEVITVYDYEELSEDAKIQVKQNYLETLDPIFFTEEVEEALRNLFPNSELKVQYSLSHCQGDGFNIYGDFYFEDFLPYWKASDGDKDTIKLCLEHVDEAYTLRYNYRYSYSMKSIDKGELEELLGTGTTIGDGRTLHY